MTILRKLRLAAVVLLLLFGIAHGADTDVQLYPQGEIVVGLDEDTSIEQINTAFGTVVRHYLPLHDLYLLDAPAGSDLETLCLDVAQTSGVIFCHPNYLVDPMRGVQSSIPFPDQQYTHESYLDQPASATMNLESIHTMSTGSEQVVAVIDGGVNLNHPAFDGMVESGWDFVDQDAVANDEPGGVNSGHGTFVAGVIHLVAPDAIIRSYRVTDEEGEADGFIVAEAILQAVEDNCDVINVSLSTVATHMAVAQACQFARGQNVVVVCAAGNESDSVGFYPGNDPNTLAVAALDDDFTLADYSSYGAHISLTAPGTDLISPFVDEGYARWSGTSFASPFVAAEAALVRSLQPSITWIELIDVLVQTAVSVDQINQNEDGLLGTGVLNLLGALRSITVECGDVTSDGMGNINDITTILSVLYGDSTDIDDVAASGLDGRHLITQNDLASTTVYLFNSFTGTYCGAVLDPIFPEGSDTLIVWGIEIPAGVSDWTLTVDCNFFAPSVAYSIALGLDLPNDSVRIGNCLLESVGDLDPYSLLFDDSASVAFAGLSFLSSYYAQGYRNLASLTIAVTPSDTVRHLTVSMANIVRGSVLYTSAISRYDEVSEHVFGWQPVLLLQNNARNVDKYGHLCFGVERGNVDMDEEDLVDIADITTLIEYLFMNGAEDIPLGEADVSPLLEPDGIVDISDLTVMIKHLMIDFVPLPECGD